MKAIRWRRLSVITLTLWALQGGERKWSKQRVYNSNSLVSMLLYSENISPSHRNRPHVGQSFTMCYRRLKWNSSCSHCSVEWAGRWNRHQTRLWSTASPYWSNGLLHLSCNVVIQLTGLLFLNWNFFCTANIQSPPGLGRRSSKVLTTTRPPASPSGLSSAVIFRVCSQGSLFKWNLALWPYSTFTIMHSSNKSQ